MSRKYRTEESPTPCAECQRKGYQQPYCYLDFDNGTLHDLTEGETTEDCDGYLKYLDGYKDRYRYHRSPHEPYMS